MSTMFSFSRFNENSPVFKQHAPSSLGVGEAYDMLRLHRAGLVVRIGKEEYFVSVETDDNPQRAIEDIAEFHLRRYPSAPPYKTPIKRPKK